jgi:hypothetical protein
MPGILKNNPATSDVCDVGDQNEVAGVVVGII